MRSIKTLVLGCVAAATVFAITATPSLAASPVWQECAAATKGSFENEGCTKEKENGGHGWLDVSETAEVAITAKEIKLSDTSSGLTVICTETDTGWIGPEGEDRITSATFSECKFSEKKVGGCTEAEGIKVQAKDLPWKTQLEEPKEKEIRDAYKNGGSGEPGWTFECTKSKEKMTDKCEGATSALMVNGGTEVEFEAKSAKVACGSSKENGEIKGKATIKDDQSGVGAARAAQPPPAAVFKVKSSREGVVLGANEMADIEIENVSGAAATALALRRVERPMNNEFSINANELTTCTNMNYAASGANSKCTFKVTYRGTNAADLVVLVFDRNGRYASNVTLGTP